jgi:hypothetical protein
MSSFLHYAEAFLPGVLLLLSEVLPFTKGKANGVLHAIYIALTEAKKMLPADAPKDGTPPNA